MANEINSLKELQKTLSQEVAEITIPNFKSPIALRIGTIDLWLFKNIFVHKEYLLPKVKLQPKLIIDCGANVGYSSIYFANKYPGAHIISVEPEDSNFVMLKYNTRNYENIECIHSAMWSTETYIKVVEQNNTTDCITVETTEDDSGAMKATTVQSLLKHSGFNQIDLLKVDIEGAEKEVFSIRGGVNKWLPRVNILTIELHDRMKRGCSHELFKAVSHYNYFFHINGENLIFIRDNLVDLS